MGRERCGIQKKKTTVNIRYNAAIDEAVTSFKKDLWEEHCPKNTYEELHCTRAVNDAGEVYRRLLEDRKTEEVAKRSTNGWFISFVPIHFNF